MRFLWARSHHRRTRMKTTRPTESRERVLLVGGGLKRASQVPGVEAGEAERASLAELAELARSAGAQIAGSIFQMRDKVDPATVIGRGKIEEVKIEAQLRKAPLIIFDRNLTPTQLRNLESGTDCATASESGRSEEHTSE